MSLFSSLFLVGVFVAELLSGQSSLECEPDILFYYPIPHERPYWTPRQYMRMDAEGNITPFFADEEYSLEIGELIGSPSGDYFAAIVTTDEQSKINLFDRRGEFIRQVVECRNECRSLSWSPDEQQMAYIDFSEADRYEWRLFFIDVDGNNRQQIAVTHSPDEGSMGRGQWSPDGRYFAYELLLVQVYRAIRIYDTSTQSESYVLDPIEQNGDAFLGWSPDSRYIMLWSNREDRGFFKVQADGSNLTHLSTMYPRTISWSPDQLQLAFMAAGREGDYSTQNIYVMDYSTGGITQITEPGVINADGYTPVAWSPTGAEILFNMWDDDSVKSVYSISLSEHEVTRLTTDTSEFESWIPCEN